MSQILGCGAVRSNIILNEMGVVSQANLGSSVIQSKRAMRHTWPEHFSHFGLRTERNEFPCGCFKEFYGRKREALVSIVWN